MKQNFQSADAVFFAAVNANRYELANRRELGARIGRTYFVRGIRMKLELAQSDGKAYATLRREDWATLTRSERFIVGLLALFQLSIPGIVQASARQTEAILFSEAAIRENMEISQTLPQAKVNALGRFNNAQKAMLLRSFKNPVITQFTR